MISRTFIIFAALIYCSYAFHGGFLTSVKLPRNVRCLEMKGGGGKGSGKSGSSSTPMTREAASRIQSAAAKQGGVEKGSFAARAQSAAERNVAAQSEATGTADGKK